MVRVVKPVGLVGSVVMRVFASVDEMSWRICLDLGTCAFWLVEELGNRIG